MKRYLAIIILAINLAGVSYLLVNEKQKTNRLLTTVQSFSEGNKHNSDSTMIETIVKRLDIAEVKKFFPELKQELKDQGINIKGLQQYQKSQLEINASFESTVKRIVTAKDTTIVSQFNDKWLKFISTYKSGDTTAKTNIQMPVPIQQVMYQDRHPFILWRFKPTIIRQDMWTDNPYAKITYNNVIEVTK